MLDSRHCPYHKSLLQSPCWHPGSSYLLPPDPNCLQPLDSLSPSFLFPMTLLFWLCTLLVSSSFSLYLGLHCLYSLSVFLSCPLPISFFSWLSPVCWPCLVYYFLSLLCTLQDALAVLSLTSTIKTLSSTTPWSGPVSVRT